MERERATRILTRIAEELTRGSFMAVPLKLFVFGSYARGALSPDDLDLLLLYEYPPDHQERLESTAGCHSVADLLRTHPEVRYAAEFRKRLRKPGEKMDLLVHHRRHDFVVSLFDGQQGIKPEDLRLVWRKGDKTAWRGRIDAIQPDPEAGRMPRNHLFPVKRLADGLNVVECVMLMIENRLLKFRLIPMESAPPKLSRRHRHFIDLATHKYNGRAAAGRKTERLLPYLCGWGDAHGQFMIFLDNRLVVWNADFNHRAHLGVPSLRAMVAQFITRANLTRQALIPHLKRSQVNGILEFERGERWDTARAEKYLEMMDVGAMPPSVSETIRMAWECE